MTAITPNASATVIANEPRWPFTAWMSRFFMVPPVLILTLISFRFITNPAHSIAGKVLSAEPEAITDTRVIGALSLTIAMVVLSAIFSNSLLRLGHAVIILVMGLVLAVRLYGFAADGTSIAMGNETRKTVGEIVFLLLNAIGLIVQTKRLKPLASH